MTLRCNAQYLGRPQHPTRYSWYRDGHQIYHHNQGINPNINSVTGSNPNANDNGDPSFNPEWFVDHVSLETRANFTCSAYNEGGVTYSEPVYIEVLGKCWIIMKEKKKKTNSCCKYDNNIIGNLRSSAKLHHRTATIFRSRLQFNTRKRILYRRMLSSLFSKLASPWCSDRSDQQSFRQRKVSKRLLYEFFCVGVRNYYTFNDIINCIHNYRL